MYEPIRHSYKRHLGIHLHWAHHRFCGQPRCRLYERRINLYRWRVAGQPTTWKVRSSRRSPTSLTHFRTPPIEVSI